MSLMTDFLDLMARGGPIMWVIFITAWVAIIMLLERLLRIHSWIQQAEADYSLLHDDKKAKPSEPQGRRASPLGLILNQVEWSEVKTKQDLSKQISTQLSNIMPTLEGVLPTVAIIGSLLPMLGLLGTVTGMIDVFEVIALHGTGDPQEMAHGISQALLTTASGLIIAIPVIFAHHLLVRRLRLLLAVTEQSIHLLMQRSLTSLKP